MRVINEQSLSQHRQSPVGCVEKRVCTHIVHRPDPLFLQYSPECFGNVQMWGIWRQIEQEEPSFLPDRPQLPYFMIAVHRGIVHYDKGVLMYAERECIKKMNNLVCGDTLRSGETFIMVLTINHSEDVEPCDSLRRNVYLLSGQLPAVWNVSTGADVALIGIVEVNMTISSLLFKFLQLPELVFVELRRGDSPWTFSYTLISCANADKKRLNVRSLASFPVACCHAALALLTLCLSCSIAARTASSSEQSMMAFRPRPGRVCRPVTPSDRKRFTHAFTDTILISVCSPAFADERPSALSRTARQRMRKQWLVPLRKPLSSCIRWRTVNFTLFVFPITFCSFYNRMQRKIKYFI